MRDVASDALKAAAAVTALLYGFKELGDQSNQAGLELSQFQDITGLSADQLQRWQQLAIHFGETAGEMTGDIKNVQAAMTDMILKGKPPEFIQAINNVLQKAGKDGISIFNARDTYGVMGKLREFAQLTKSNPDITNPMLASLGLSQKTIGALRTSQFDLNRPDRSRLYSQSQIKTLNDLSIRWSELVDKIQHGIGNLNIKFGPSLLKDIEKLIPSIFKMVDAFAALTEKLELIKEVGKIFTGWTALFTAIGDAANFAKKPGGGAEALNLIKNQFHGTNLSDLINSTVSDVGSRVFGNSSQGQTNNSVQITVHGVEGDSSSIGAEIAAHVSQAFRQLPQGGSGGGT